MRFLKCLTSVLLAASLCLCFVSCKGEGKNDNEQNAQPSLTVAEDASELDDEVTITVPLASIDEEYQNDLDAYCKKYGYTSAKLNKVKKTVTIKCNAFRHDLLVAKVGVNVLRAIYDLQDDKSYPYLISVDSVNDDDFSTAEITVDEKNFQDLLPFDIGQKLLLWQLYKGDGEYGADITVKNKNGDVIDTFHYSNEDK